MLKRHCRLLSTGKTSKLDWEDQITGERTLLYRVWVGPSLSYAQSSQSFPQRSSILSALDRLLFPISVLIVHELQRPGYAASSRICQVDKL